MDSGRHSRGPRQHLTVHGPFCIRGSPMTRDTCARGECRKPAFFLSVVAVVLLPVLCGAFLRAVASAHPRFAVPVTLATVVVQGAAAVALSFLSVKVNHPRVAEHQTRPRVQLERTGKGSSRSVTVCLGRRKSAVTFRGKLPSRVIIDDGDEKLLLGFTEGCQCDLTLRVERELAATGGHTPRTRVGW